MTGNFRVVLDACVLIPMPLVDTLLRLASEPSLYIPQWTDEIMNEVSRNLREDFKLTEAQIAHRENQMREHFGEAWVEGYEDLIPAMTNHEKDRHVLAAAVRSGSEVIVTYNRKDFPHSALAPYGVTVQGPSTFLTNLYQMDKEAVVQTLRDQAENIGRPVNDLLNRLRLDVPGFVASFMEQV